MYYRRKKPAIVEAFRWGVDIAPLWAFEAKSTGYIHADAQGLSINTLEGSFPVAVGDYIIKGAQGELSSCTSGVFQTVYEPCEGEEP